MAMMKCEECGHEISDKAEFCPNCGYRIPKNETVNQKEEAKKDDGWIRGSTPVQPVVQKKKKKGSKKLITGIVIFFLFCALVNALSGSDDEQETNGTEVTNQSVEQPQEKTGEKIEKAKEEKKEEKKDTNANFETGKIYSGHKCKFNLSKGDKKGFSIEIENKSKKDYSFDIHSMSINGIMTNCNIYTGSVSVPSGKKGMMEINFENEWLEGIDIVEYVDFIIWVYDDAKNFKDFETDIIRVKTDKFQKENKFKAAKGSKKDGGLVIQKEKLDTEEFVFSVINKNKYFVEFDFNNSSINGWAFEDDYLFDAKSINVYPNCKTTIKIDISEFADKNGIDKIKNIEFSLGVREKGDYFKETDTKKIKFK